MIYFFFYCIFVQYFVHKKGIGFVVLFIQKRSLLDFSI
jgi:hypothetical protein